MIADALQAVEPLAGRALLGGGRSFAALADLAHRDILDGHGVIPYAECNGYFVVCDSKLHFQ